MTVRRTEKKRAYRAGVGLAILGLLATVACTQVDEPAPTHPTQALPKIRTRIDRRFTLRGIVDQSQAYTATFHINYGKVVPTVLNDSLSWQPDSNQVMLSDSGTYDICYGADCKTGVIVFYLP